MSDMLTRLSISISGKPDGKEDVANMVAAGICHFGGAVPQRKGDRNGVYLTVELPAAAMAALRDGKSDCPSELVSYLGDDVEIRDGMIRAMICAVSGLEKPEMAVHFTSDPAVELLAFDDAKLDCLNRLLECRAVAAKVVEKTGGRSHFVSAPRFVDAVQLENLLVESAQAEIARIDGELAQMGLRYEAAK